MQITRRLGGYHILATIGQGGMGEVYLAIKDGPGGFEKLLVLKVLQHNLIMDPEFLAMFLDEGRIAARLNHPNVVQTFETGRDDNYHFIVMEYLNGVTLGQLMQALVHPDKPISASITRFFLTVLSQALNGLHHAHELCDYDGLPLHIVHRDATPQNIFVTYDGAVKVVDFGIAKALDSSSDTRAGAFKGKLGYLPPEQITSVTVDRRADIFAVGVILFEILSGRRLYRGKTEMDILSALSNGTVPDTASLPAAIPDDLKWIVSRATAAAPSQRYDTAREFMDDIEDFLGEMGGAMSTRDIANLICKQFASQRKRAAQCIEQQLKLYGDYQHGRLDGKTPTAWNMIPRLCAVTYITGDAVAENVSSAYLATSFANDATVDYRLPRTGIQTPKKSKIKRLAVTGIIAVCTLVLTALLWWKHTEWGLANILSRDFFSAAPANDLKAFRPAPRIGVDNPRPDAVLVEISGDIEEDTVLTNNQIYLLKSIAYVHSGVSLMIQQGTVIRGDAATAGMLVVRPGARIIAQGTPDNPIVFTSSKPENERAAGDWGGVVILGQAPANSMINGRQAVIDGLSTGGEYGGDNPDDDSGIMEYVRIEYAGKSAMVNSEASALTLGGVGRFTRLNHIQIRHSSDDCFRFVGGTADGKYLICQSPGDDGVDWDNGYTGRLQFVLVTGKGENTGGAHGVEGDNNSRGTALAPVSAPQLYNATLCGQYNQRVRNHFGVLARRGTHGLIGNSIITGFSAGLDVQGDTTRIQILASTFYDNILSNVAFSEHRNSNGVFRDDDNGFNEYRWINQRGQNNSYEDPGIPGCIRRVGDNYKPETPVSGGIMPPNDGFFDSTATYRGAFRNEFDNWDDGNWVKWM
ncbi:MAG: serine/threonine protein kinase [Deltaproteobacteria bacterium]|nr:serine/threonine protein kinase [Deltaproteobacteria bacterium]